MGEVDEVSEALRKPEASKVPVIGLGQIIRPYEITPFGTVESDRGEEKHRFGKRNFELDLGFGVGLPMELTLPQRKGLKRGLFLTPLDPGAGYPLDARDVSWDTRHVKLQELQDDLNKPLDADEATRVVSIHCSTDQLVKAGIARWEKEKGFVVVPEIKSLIEQLVCVINTPISQERLGRMGSLAGLPSPALLETWRNLAYEGFFPVETGPLPFQSKAFEEHFTDSDFVVAVPADGRLQDLAIRFHFKDPQIGRGELQDAFAHLVPKEERIIPYAGRSFRSPDSRILQ